MTFDELLRQICGGEIPPDVRNELEALRQLWFGVKRLPRTPGSLAAEWVGYSLSVLRGSPRFKFYFTHPVKEPEPLRTIVDSFPFDHQDVSGIKFRARCGGGPGIASDPGPFVNVLPGMRLTASSFYEGDIIGTVGAFLQDTSQDEAIWILSANHVLASNNDPLYQIQSICFDTSDKQYQVQEVRYVPLQSGTGNAADVAIARLAADPDLEALADPGLLQAVDPNPAPSITPDMTVTRCRAGELANPVTLGTEVELAPELEYDSESCGIPYAIMENQYLVSGTNFSVPGDSGSTVLVNINGTSFVVGMVFADSETVTGHKFNLTAVTPFNNLLYALNTNLDSGQNLGLSLYQGPPTILG